MTIKENYADLLNQQRVLPLFYDDDHAFCIDVVKTFYDAGLRSIEFTNRGEHALRNFREMVKNVEKSMPGMVLAVGTIKTKNEVKAFVDAGAKVLISPFYDAEVDAEARNCGTLWIPGVMSVGELHLAHKSNRHLVKLFPANILTPAFIEAVKPLFPDVKFLVTGGVDLTSESIGSWTKASVTAMGLGSKLITKSIINHKDINALKANLVVLKNLLSHVQ